MPRKSSKAVVSKLEASAKASAEAKIEYSRKRTITEVVPADVTRAKSRTWRTLLSPLVGYAGRKGDEQQRLQQELREETLKEIIFRARATVIKGLGGYKSGPYEIHRAVSRTSLTRRA
jgi:hypothetical protein